MPTLRAAALLMLVVLLMRVPVHAQELGHTRFENSGAPEAQEAFLRGLLLLHSFEYEDAREAFVEARGIDPDFAIAYWGEAMGYNHPVWQTQETEQARAVMESLAPTLEQRLAKAPSLREKDYLRAADVLFFSHEDKKERDLAYATAMQELYEAYPEDLDAAALYALSILGTSHDGRDFAKYMRAAAIAEGVFAKNPRHPGAAHYLIHSYDDPIHAPLGLRAAFVYADIAPAASHALHMPSHIFVAMGMWDRVVASNQASFAAADARVERKALGVGDRAFHALRWLAYGQLQQGRLKDAMETLHAIQKDVERSDGSSTIRRHLVVTRAAYVIESEEWSGEAAGIEVDTMGLGSETEATDVFVVGLSAFKRGKMEKARQGFSRLMALADKEPNRPVLAILRDELKALLLVDEGREEDALALLREAAEMESNMAFDFGPPSPVKPSHELLGEVLLSMGHAAEAQAAFSSALGRAPKRARSLIGLAAAAAQAGDTVVALRAENTLQEIGYAPVIGASSGLE